MCSSISILPLVLKEDMFQVFPWQYLRMLTTFQLLVLVLTWEPLTQIGRFHFRLCQSNQVAEQFHCIKLGYRVQTSSALLNDFCGDQQKAQRPQCFVAIIAAHNVTAFYGYLIAQLIFFKSACIYFWIQLPQCLCQCPVRCFSIDLNN